jgi:homocysteine S-methyltransferase
MTRVGLAAMLARGPVVLDGALATELERRGHDLSDSLWSARLLRDAPADIEAIHRSYFAAGADVATTASYHATYEGFAAAGIGRDATTRLLRLSVELAQNARDALRPGGLVAASVGPYAVVRADGSEYTGDYGGVAARRIADTQRPRIEALLAAGPDVLALETIPSIREVDVLVGLLDELPGAEAWITFCCRDGERLSDGTPIEEAVGRAGAGRGVVALGVNCTAPEHVDALLERARAATGLPLLAYPNSGRTWDGERGEWRGGGVERFPAEAIRGWQRRGARGIGGCCGIGPDAIAGIARAVAPNVAQQPL